MSTASLSWIFGFAVGMATGTVTTWLWMLLSAWLYERKINREIQARLHVPGHSSWHD